VALVAPPSNLFYVKEEVKAIRATGLQVQTIEELPALETFLQTGQAEVVHFACHGQFKSALPDRSVVVIGKRSLRPADLTAENRNFGRARPLVFLNACDSGRLGLGLTGLGGWAKAFLKADAGFFIGSVWKTTDELAARFAQTFYERLQAGDSIGEAMRRAREAARRSGDATYLSYTLYANPCVRAARALE
jgi:CHAT domain-containing protein